MHPGEPNTHKVRHGVGQQVISATMAEASLGGKRSNPA